jgi:hypothetical protein
MPRGTRVVTKICDWAEYHNRLSSKSIRVTKLSVCQNDSPKNTSFWKTNSLATHTFFFDLCLLEHLAQSHVRSIMKSMKYVLDQKCPVPVLMSRVNYVKSQLSKYQLCYDSDSQAQLCQF